jgi:DNA-binding MarR family transcriptional regulator
LLTPAGEQKIVTALARIRKHEEALLSGLSAAERQTLIDLLSRIEAGRD